MHFAIDTDFGSAVNNNYHFHFLFLSRVDTMYSNNANALAKAIALARKKLGTAV